MSDLTTDIERRVSTHIAVARYLRSSRKFDEANREFIESCKSLRQELGPNAKFVVQVDFIYYLVTSDNSGSFDVQEISCI